MISVVFPSFTRILLHDTQQLLQARIDEIRAAITELRQNQLAINASLESLSVGN